MMKLQIVALLLSISITGTAMSQSLPSREHQEGYCAGFMAAMDMINRNRDHYRRLLGAPEMSSTEVLKWIYAQPWKNEGTHRTAPRRLDQPAGEPKVGPPALESIDLYLIPGITGCRVRDDGSIEYEQLNWR